MDKKAIPKNKKILIFFAIAGLLVMGTAIIQLEKPVDDFQRYTQTAGEYAPHIAGQRDSGSQSVFGLSTVAGLCALYLLCYLFVFSLRKGHIERQAELEARENSLYKLSRATGRSEYELFQLSAQNWMVSSDRIGQDYRRYMTDRTMPFYAKDFVKRNQSQIDPSLMKEKEEVKPNTWQDWAKVLIVFPGSIIFLIVMIIGAYS